MELQWRGKQYTFEPRTLLAEKDKEGRGAKVTIDKNIYGCDTESVLLPDRYEPFCFQTSSETLGESLVYLEEREKALHKFIEHYVRYYSWMDFEEHYAFMYAHNLMYDWIQLIKYYDDLIAIARTGVGLKEDYEIYRTGDYIVSLRKRGLFTGNAPHFTLNIKASKREWVDLMFRDTFSFFPVSLDKLAKDLKLDTRKEDRDEGIGLIDWRKEPDSERKQKFEKYAKTDPLVTRLAAEKIRELHRISEMKRIRVSGPGFAINKLFHIIPEGTEIRQGDFDSSIMQLVLDTYAGGRTGGIYHGEVKNLAVLDFHSSYPASMTTLPSFSPTMEYVRYETPEELDESALLEIIDECHCFMRIDGEETDSKYPALITNIKGKLTPVFGEFENLATTGVEVSVGIRGGGLKVNRVRELVLLLEMEPPEVLPFKMWIESAYNRKAEAEEGTAEYQSAKTEMNSGYGKLIESRTETPVGDEVRDIILPYVEGEEHEFGLMYYSEYIESLNPNSDRTFEERYPEMIEQIFEDFEGENILHANFGELSLTKLEYGRYVVPAAASLITATSRARLLAFVKSTRSEYWDTDSGFIEDFEIEKVKKQLEIGSTWLPPYVLPLTIGKKLGELGIEIEEADGYLAGTKRYYLKSRKLYPDKKTGELKPKIKKALHGIPTAPFDIAGDMIKALATGQNFEYQGRPRPKGVKETRDRNELGKFESRKYKSQFHLDDRLSWEQTPGGWVGNVRPLSTLKTNS